MNEESRSTSTEEYLIYHEEQVLNNAQALLAQPSLSVEALQAEYEKLIKEYSRLYKKLNRTTSHGDRLLLTIKELHDKLNQQNNALKEAARLRDDIEHITRHDLKSPLSSIIGLTHLLLTDDLTDSQLETLKMIEDVGYQMLNMINISLDLYRMEAGLYALIPKEVQLIKLIYKVINSLKTLSHSKDVDFQLTMHHKIVAQDELFYIRGDELLCYSILTNLIKNAIEASPNHQHIAINIEKIENFAKISIYNQGIVPTSIRDRFFNKYVTAGKSNGTGLGTYSAKLMVETQGGSIHLDTDDPKATTITFYLPL